MAPVHASHTFALGTCSFQQFFAILIWINLLAMGEGVQFQNLAEVTILVEFQKASFASVNVNSGAPWLNWNTEDATPCNWAGVTCTSNKTVEELDFSGWGLNPFITSVAILGSLPDLNRFDMSSNGDAYIEFFRGIGLETETLWNIPQDIGNLTGLTYLDLSKNSYGGLIPPSISACQKLRYLSLEQNLLQGDVSHLGGLGSLQFLFLGDNQLTGPFPQDVQGMFDLVTLDLSNNFLNGTIPALPNSNLLDLRLDSNNFTSIEESFFSNAMKLVHLYVSDNGLGGRIPASIIEMKSIQVLNLSRNQLSGEIPSGFSQAYQTSILNRVTIFNLDFSQNSLSGPIPPNFVQQLNVPFCYVSINFSHNSLTENIPNLFEEMPSSLSFTIVLSLDLSHNLLSGPIDLVFNSTVILSLLLHENQLSGNIIESLLTAPANIVENMAELRLQNNHLNGDLSRVSLNWSSWSSLQVVDLSNNNLRWSTTATIQDPLRAAIENFPVSLKEFRVAGNDFSGISLPKTLQLINVSNVIEVLDFSNDHLTGVISGAAFNCTWLPSLQFLDLSDNSVSGSIPSEILSFQNLSTFNVSNNSLSGSLSFIDSSSRLYNPKFFAKNPGLCDGPLASCETGSKQVPWWMILIMVGGSTIIAVGSSVAAIWQWKVYQRRYQQDAELIKTLLEGDSAALMSLRELQRATDNFAESSQIGEGGFGKVYKGKLTDGTMVAIKRSKREGFENNRKQFLNEVRIWSQVSHRYLVKLLGCCMENKIALLVFEFVSNGTLQEHLQGKIEGTRLCWKQRLNIAVQTADALNYLHSSATFPIIHRDVKSANILLDQNLNAKVTDFGISKLAPMEVVTHFSATAIQGTFGYIDPDYYVTCQLTAKSDVYSFGVVLLELISAKAPIDPQRGEENTSLVLFAHRHIESGDLQGLIDPILGETYGDPTGHGRESIFNVGRLAMKCLNVKSKTRPSMMEVWKELQDIWLAELDDHNFDSAPHDTIFSRFEESSSSSDSNLRSRKNEIFSDIEMSQFSLKE